jgi:hypothetical protein
MDLLWIGVVVVLFAATLGLISLCDQGNDQT